MAGVLAIILVVELTYAGYAAHVLPKAPEPHILAAVISAAWSHLAQETAPAAEAPAPAPADAGTPSVDTANAPALTPADTGNTSVSAPVGNMPDSTAAPSSSGSAGDNAGNDSAGNGDTNVPAGSDASAAIPAPAVGDTGEPSPAAEGASAPAENSVQAGADVNAVAPAAPLAPQSADDISSVSATEAVPVAAPAEQAAPAVTEVAAAPVAALLVESYATQDAAIAAAATPAEQTSLAVAYAAEKIDTLDAPAVKNDFSNGAFVVTNLLKQVDTIVANTAKVNDPAVVEKVKEFKAAADASLRSSQLTVPEDLEQDMEITRGKLLSL